MGRKEGTEDTRIRVAVSGSMADLRRMQSVLNRFWQSSELAYGYLLSTMGSEMEDEERPTAEVLGHIQSEAWYPNNQGRIKHGDTIGQTLAQVRENTVHVFRATLISFFAAFEAYLEAEVKRPKRRDGPWGPYVRSLVSLRAADSPLPLRVVLCADVCREVRNRMVHESFKVPKSLDEACLNEWKDRLRRHALGADWPEREVDEELNYAFNHVIGQASNLVEEAKKQDKTLSIEFFYMLFSFTNLDSLAFAIEEAIQPLHSRPGGEVLRKPEAVRRKDLVVSAA